MVLPAGSSTTGVGWRGRHRATRLLQSSLATSSSSRLRLLEGLGDGSIGAESGLRSFLGGDGSIGAESGLRSFLGGEGGSSVGDDGGGGKKGGGAGVFLVGEGREREADGLTFE